jgi:hypothetical protein
VFAANQFGPRFDSVLDLKIWLGPACQPPSLIPLVRCCSALPQPLPCRCMLLPPLAALLCCRRPAARTVKCSLAFKTAPPLHAIGTRPSHCLAAAASTTKCTHPLPRASARTASTRAGPKHRQDGAGIACYLDHLLFLSPQSACKLLLLSAIADKSSSTVAAISTTAPPRPRHRTSALRHPGASYEHLLAREPTSHRQIHFSPSCHE